MTIPPADSGCSSSRDARVRAWLDKAHVLLEALPFMQRYDRKTVVIKYGGHAMNRPELAESFARDVVLLKQAGVNPIVVHGGGPQIDVMLKRLDMEPRFADGLRITDAATMEVIEMVLSGTLNKQIVGQFRRAGGQAVGLSGKDGKLIVARKAPPAKSGADLGLVGEPWQVNPHCLWALLESGQIPVIAPVGLSADGQTYNINADSVAGALAAAMGAVRLLLLTDVAGVLDGNGGLIEDMDLQRASEIMKGNGVSGGMIPKLRTAITAVEQGVEAVVILDGRVPHAVLLELLTEHGIGSLIH